MVSLCLLPGVY